MGDRYLPGMAWSVAIKPSEPKRSLGSAEQVKQALEIALPGIRWVDGEPEDPKQRLSGVLAVVDRILGPSEQAEGTFEEDGLTYLAMLEGKRIGWFWLEVSGALGNNPVPVLRRICEPNGWLAFDERNRIDLSAETSPHWENHVKAHTVPVHPAPEGEPHVFELLALDDEVGVYEGTCVLADNPFARYRAEYDVDTYDLAEPELYEADDKDENKPILITVMAGEAGLDASKREAFDRVAAELPLCVAAIRDAAVAQLREQFAAPKAAAFVAEHFERCIQFSGIRIFEAQRDGVNYHSLDFSPGWDEEHGFEVLMVGSAVIEYAGSTYVEPPEGGWKE